MDLGETREISEIAIQWRYGGKGRDFDILTSMDGESWTTAKSVRGNGDFFQTIELDEAVNARYVKIQGIASNASVYMIQEFMVYEAVDKAALTAALDEAKVLLDEENKAMIFARAMQESPLATRKEVAAALAQLQTAMEEAQPQMTFTDVPEGSFYYDSVLWAARRGITTGITPTTFAPNNPCMRAHVVTFLWRAAGSPEPTGTEHPFVDVKPADFYYKPVLWALEKGITAGMDATHFGPTVYCNRAQVVTFLHRTMGSPKPGTEENPFADVKKDVFYEIPVLWAVENGITAGLSATTFGPDTVCNRAQIVTFLYRAFVS